MAFLNGLTTIISMAVFLGIVWWAWSKARVKANEEASQLPFSLPDEADSDVKNREVKS